MKILLAEDNEKSREYLSDFLNQGGHSVTTAENGRQALDYFKTRLFDLVITDIKMPELTGIEFLRQISVYKNERDYDVIIFTAYGDMETAIEALRMGVSDYLQKPVDIEVLADVIRRIEEKRANRIPKQADKAVPTRTSGHSPLVPGIGPIGIYSQAMKNIVEMAAKFHGDRSIPVLILGETGTGKEVVAKLIHYDNSDIQEPFVDINCANLTSTMFESELFGYESGAFTGAQKTGSKGKIDLANGGTLFLDEIGEMSIELQAKLLRVIQEKEFYRVGGLKKISADLRIICATNIDIQKRVEEGKFRKDLYYRLNIGQFVLPPLKERKEDIIPLAEMFIEEFCTKRSKRFVRISKKAKGILLGHDWPGNVRELKNLMESIVFNIEGPEITDECLDLVANEIGKEKNHSPAAPVMAQGYIKRLVKALINETLELNNGNKTETARSLGMSRRTLYRHLERSNKLNEAESPGTY